MNECRKQFDDWWNEFSSAHEDWRFADSDALRWQAWQAAWNRRASPASAPELREQVEKLTKERDDLRSRRCEVCGYLEHEREHTGCLREQLAALAEQNEKMREALQKLACLGNGEQYGNSIGNCIAQEALSLPDLTSPVLNRIRAEENEAIIAAANALENIASTSSSTRIRRVANDALTAIRARRNHG